MEAYSSVSYDLKFIADDKNACTHTFIYFYTEIRRRHDRARLQSFVLSNSPLVSTATDSSALICQTPMLMQPFHATTES